MWYWKIGVGIRVVEGVEGCWFGEVWEEGWMMRGWGRIGFVMLWWVVVVK